MFSKLWNSIFWRFPVFRWHFRYSSAILWWWLRFNPPRPGGWGSETSHQGCSSLDECFPCKDFFLAPYCVGWDRTTPLGCSVQPYPTRLLTPGEGTSKPWLKNPYPEDSECFSLFQVQSDPSPWLPRLGEGPATFYSLAAKPIPLGSLGSAKVPWWGFITPTPWRSSPITHFFPHRS